jgi:hypothetical protein
MTDDEISSFVNAVNTAGEGLRPEEVAASLLGCFCDAARHPTEPAGLPMADD